TFQHRTAKRIMELVRSLRPEARLVVGGYDASLAPEAYEAPSPGRADFIVRGEGEGMRACSGGTPCWGGRSTSSKLRAVARSTAVFARSSRCAAETSTPLILNVSSRT